MGTPLRICGSFNCSVILYSKRGNNDINIISLKNAATGAQVDLIREICDVLLKACLLLPSLESPDR